MATGITWIPCPDDELPSGVEAENLVSAGLVSGEKVIVARAVYSEPAASLELVYPGFSFKGSFKFDADAVYDGNFQFQVLKAPPGSFYWANNIKHRQIPSNAVPGGYEIEEEFYIGRVRQPRGWCVGRITLSTTRQAKWCHYWNPFTRRAEETQEFEILVTMPPSWMNDAEIPERDPRTDEEQYSSYGWTPWSKKIDSDFMVSAEDGGEIVTLVGRIILLGTSKGFKYGHVYLHKSTAQVEPGPAFDVTEHSGVEVLLAIPGTYYWSTLPRPHIPRSELTHFKEEQTSFSITLPDKGYTRVTRTLIQQQIDGISNWIVADAKHPRKYFEPKATSLDQTLFVTKMHEVLVLPDLFPDSDQADLLGWAPYRKQMKTSFMVAVGSKTREETTQFISRNYARDKGHILQVRHKSGDGVEELFGHEILLGRRPAQSLNLNWVPDFGGYVPHDALHGGYNEHGESIYLGKSPENREELGTIVPSSKHLETFTRSAMLGTYQVLVHSSATPAAPSTVTNEDEMSHLVSALRNFQRKYLHSQTPGTKPGEALIELHEFLNNLLAERPNATGLLQTSSDWIPYVSRLSAIHALPQTLRPILFRLIECMPKIRPSQRAASPISQTYRLASIVRSAIQESLTSEGPSDFVQLLDFIPLLRYLDKSEFLEREKDSSSRIVKLLLHSWLILFENPPLGVSIRILPEKWYPLVCRVIQLIDCAEERARIFRRFKKAGVHLDQEGIYQTQPKDIEEDVPWANWETKRESLKSAIRAEWSNWPPVPHTVQVQTLGHSLVAEQPAETSPKGCLLPPADSETIAKLRTESGGMRNTFNQAPMSVESIMEKVKSEELNEDEALSLFKQLLKPESSSLSTSSLQTLTNFAKNCNNHQVRSNVIWAMAASLANNEKTTKNEQLKPGTVKFQLEEALEAIKTENSLASAILTALSNSAGSYSLDKEDTKLAVKLLNFLTDLTGSEEGPSSTYIQYALHILLVNMNGSNYDPSFPSSICQCLNSTSQQVRTLATQLLTRVTVELEKPLEEPELITLYGLFDDAVPNTRAFARAAFSNGFWNNSTLHEREEMLHRLPSTFIVHTVEVVLGAGVTLSREDFTDKINLPLYNFLKSAKNSVSRKVLSAARGIHKLSNKLLSNFAKQEKSNKLGKQSLRESMVDLLEESEPLALTPVTLADIENLFLRNDASEIELNGLCLQVIIRYAQNQFKCVGYQATEQLVYELVRRMLLPWSDPVLYPLALHAISNIQELPLALYEDYHMEMVGLRLSTHRSDFKAINEDKKLDIYDLMKQHGLDFEDDDSITNLVWWFGQYVNSGREISERNLKAMLKHSQRDGNARMMVFRKLKECLQMGYVIPDRAMDHIFKGKSSTNYRDETQLFLYFQPGQRIQTPIAKEILDWAERESIPSEQYCSVVILLTAIMRMGESQPPSVVSSVIRICRTIVQNSTVNHQKYGFQLTDLIRRLIHAVLVSKEVPNCDLEAVKNFILELQSSPKDWMKPALREDWEAMMVEDEKDPTDEPKYTELGMAIEFLKDPRAHGMFTWTEINSLVGDMSKALAGSRAHHKLFHQEAHDLYTTRVQEGGDGRRVRDCGEEPHVFFQILNINFGTKAASIFRSVCRVIAVPDTNLSLPSHFTRKVAEVLPSDPSAARSILNAVLRASKLPQLQTLGEAIFTALLRTDSEDVFQTCESTLVMLLRRGVWKPSEFTLQCGGALKYHACHRMTLSLQKTELIALVEHIEAQRSDAGRGKAWRILIQEIMQIIGNFQNALVTTSDVASVEPKRDKRGRLYHFQVEDNKNSTNKESFSVFESLVESALLSPSLIKPVPATLIERLQNFALCDEAEISQRLIVFKFLKEAVLRDCHPNAVPQDLIDFTFRLCNLPQCPPWFKGFLLEQLVNIEEKFPNAVLGDRSWEQVLGMPSPNLPSWFENLSPFERGRFMALISSYSHGLECLQHMTQCSYPNFPLRLATQNFIKREQVTDEVEKKVIDEGLRKAFDRLRFHGKQSLTAHLFSFTTAWHTSNGAKASTGRLPKELLMKMLFRYVNIEGPYLSHTALHDVTRQLVIFYITEEIHAKRMAGERAMPDRSTTPGRFCIAEGLLTACGRDVQLALWILSHIKQIDSHAALERLVIFLDNKFDFDNFDTIRTALETSAAYADIQTAQDLLVELTIADLSIAFPPDHEQKWPNLIPNMRELLRRGMMDWNALRRKDFSNDGKISEQNRLLARGRAYSSGTLRLELSDSQLDCQLSTSIIWQQYVDSNQPACRAKSRREVVSEFGGQHGLGEVDLNQLLDMVEQVCGGYVDNSVLPLVCERIPLWHDDKIQAWARACQRTRRLYVVEYLAVARTAIERLRGWSLTTVQILSTYLALTKDSTEGLLQQVSTGCGKSTIIALVAAFKALQGHYVDIHTSSPLLAERDAVEWSKFYQLFDLTVSHNGEASADSKFTTGGAKPCYSAQIVYGEIRQFQFDALRHDYFGQGTRSERTYGVGIVDEVDAIYVDEGAKLTILSSNIPGLELLQPLYHTVWRACVKLNKTLNVVQVGSMYYHDSQSAVPRQGINGRRGLKTFTETELQQEGFRERGTYFREELKNFVTLLVEGENQVELQPCLQGLYRRVQLPKHVKKFAKRQINAWTDSAITAVTLNQDEDYVVSDDGQICPIDPNNGVTQTTSNWSNGLQQFLQIKHSLAFTPETLTTAFMSNKAMLEKYGETIVGFSGTLGEAEKQDFYPKQQLKSLIIPDPYFKTLVTFPPLVVPTREKWLEEVVAAACTEAEDYRAVLVICRTIRDATQVKSKLLEENVNLSLKFHVRSDLDNESFNKGGDGSSSLYVRGRDVFVTTPLSSRGTDIKSPNLNPVGGLHVILTFLPHHRRIQEQVLGRTARQGNFGTAQLIIMSADTTDSGQAFQLATSVRDGFEKNSVKNLTERVYPEITNKYTAFVDFLQSLHRVHEGLGGRRKGTGALPTGTRTLAKPIKWVLSGKLTEFDWIILQAVQDYWAFNLHQSDSSQVVRGINLDQLPCIINNITECPDKPIELDFQVAKQIFDLVQSCYYPTKYSVKFYKQHLDIIGFEKTKNADEFFKLALEYDYDLCVGAHVGIAFLTLHGRRVLPSLRPRHGQRDYKEVALEHLDKALETLVGDLSHLQHIQLWVMDGTSTRNAAKQLRSKLDALQRYTEAILRVRHFVQDSLRTVYLTAASSSEYNEEVTHIVDASSNVDKITNVGKNTSSSLLKQLKFAKATSRFRLSCHGLTWKKDLGHQAEAALKYTKTIKKNRVSVSFHITETAQIQAFAALAEKKRKEFNFLTSIGGGRSGDLELLLAAMFEQPTDWELAYQARNWFTSLEMNDGNERMQSEMDELENFLQKLANGGAAVQLSVSGPVCEVKNAISSLPPIALTCVRASFEYQEIDNEKSDESAKAATPQARQQTYRKSFSLGDISSLFPKAAISADLLLDCASSNQERMKAITKFITTCSDPQLQVQLIVSGFKLGCNDPKGDPIPNRENCRMVKFPKLGAKTALALLPLLKKYNIKPMVCFDGLTRVEAQKVLDILNVKQDPIFRQQLDEFKNFMPHGDAATLAEMRERGLSLIAQFQEMQGFRATSCILVGLLAFAQAAAALYPTGVGAPFATVLGVSALGDLWTIGYTGFACEEFSWKVYSMSKLAGLLFGLSFVGLDALQAGSLDALSSAATLDLWDVLKKFGLFPVKQIVVVGAPLVSGKLTDTKLKPEILNKVETEVGRRVQEMEMRELLKTLHALKHKEDQDVTLRAEFHFMHWLCEEGKLLKNTRRAMKESFIASTGKEGLGAVLGSQPYAGLALTLIAVVEKAVRVILQLRSAAVYAKEACDVIFPAFKQYLSQFDLHHVLLKYCDLREEQVEKFGIESTGKVCDFNPDVLPKTNDNLQFITQDELRGAREELEKLREEKAKFEEAQYEALIASLSAFITDEIIGVSSWQVYKTTSAARRIK